MQWTGLLIGAPARSAMASAAVPGEPATAARGQAAFMAPPASIGRAKGLLLRAHDAMNPRAVAGVALVAFLAAERPSLCHEAFA